MSQAPSPVVSAAAILAARRASGEQGPPLPEWCRPLDMDTALAVQAAVTAQLGDRIGAWKCGMPGGNHLVLAPIHAGTIHAAGAGACVARVRAGQVRVEPELAFILGHDLPARNAPYTPAEVDAAIVRTHLALELIDSRYSNPADASFAENLADGLLNQGLCIGPQVNGENARTASTMAIRVSLESGQEIRLHGRHPSADPRAPLFWLAEFLRSKGQGLRAGQAVITGSYAGSFDVPVEQEIAVRYGDLGVLATRFARG
jgi:2-keto-4-pentenoate hydratase